jgi:hypothetical protein
MKTTPLSTESVVELPFRLESLSPIPDPEGGSAVWHRYVIIQGTNTITGMRCGSRTELIPVIDQMIERLNERFAKKQAKARR